MSLKEDVPTQLTAGARYAPRRIADAFSRSPSIRSSAISFGPEAPSPGSSALSFEVPNNQASSALALFIDAVFIVATSVVAGLGYHHVALNVPGDIANFLATGVVAAILFCGLTRLIMGNHPLRVSNAFDRARDSSIAWVFTIFVFLFVTFTLKVGEDLSRGAVLTFFALGMVAAIASRVRSPMVLARAREAGTFPRRCAILLGAAGDTSLPSLAGEITRSSLSPPTVVTFDANCDGKAWALERQTMCANVHGLARSFGPGEIYLAASHIPAERLDSVIRALSLLPRAVLLVPDPSTAALLRYPVTAVGGAIAVQLQNEPLNVVQRAFKRIIDVTVSLAGLIVLSPFLVGVALAIRRDSLGPALFKQVRNGYQGRAFKILKFRTMTVQEDGDQVTQARQGDERVTRIGRWLRRTSLDELPQLINVLKGEISLVGPRPHARAHDELYSKIIENYEIRQHVKPGITGWAQVNGLRGETRHPDTMYRRIEHDLWYATHCSLALDMQILARTALVVVMRHGAY